MRISDSVWLIGAAGRMAWSRRSPISRVLAERRANRQAWASDMISVLSLRRLVPMAGWHLLPLLMGLCLVAFAFFV